MVFNLLIGLLSSFQVRLLIAELMLFSSFGLRRGGHLLLTLGVALICSVPEVLTLTLSQSF